MVLEAVYKVARCLGHLSVHQHLRLAGSCSTQASDNGLREAQMWFAGRCWLGLPILLFQEGLGLSVLSGSWMNPNYWFQ